MVYFRNVPLSGGGVLSFVVFLFQLMKALDNLEPTPLSPVEEDICRVLQQEMNVAVTPCLPDGVLTLHLVMGKTVLQVIGIAEGGHRE